MQSLILCLDIERNNFMSPTSCFNHVILPHRQAVSRCHNSYMGYDISLKIFICNDKYDNRTYE